MANSNVSEAGQTQMNPGDEAASGTPGTAEDVCPACHGTRQVDGRTCENCGGTGRIIRGIGGHSLVPLEQFRGDRFGPMTLAQPRLLLKQP